MESMTEGPRGEVIPVADSNKDDEVYPGWG